MNTSQLKKFAATARRKLIEQVSARLEYILSTDSAEIRNKSRQVGELKVQLAANGKPAMVERIAYTWFNRLMALRFMDVNGYTSPKVVTPAEGMLQPEVLEEAKRGQFQHGLNVNVNYLNDMLDGRIAFANPQNETYRHLLVAVCNSWHNAMPFLFERIDDFTELLMPDDLLSDDSIVSLVRSGMNEEDCRNVEIIGWLYQFYIAEKKDQVFASKTKVKAEDIPAATQLFTPRWIVEYMVQNSVGKLWVRNKKNSALKALMPYYIASPSDSHTQPLIINAATDIQLLDPACGSGHILVYAFDLLVAIYEEEGYSSAEIPQLILENNLVGIDIDERAAQLSAFALTMKARAYFPRFFRNPVAPRITALQAFPLDDRATKELFDEAGLTLSDTLKYDLELMRRADNFGSLIIPHSPNSELEQLKRQLNASPLKQQLLWQGKAEILLNCLNQLIVLGTKYTCVVANPPYMGGNMNLELSDFVKTNYPASKSDLMACFMESTLFMLTPQGYLGMINQHSWMFLSSYEALRKKMLLNVQFDTMLHLGPRTFPEIGGEVVQNTSFTFIKQAAACEGLFIRLVDYRTTKLKEIALLAALEDPDKKDFFLASPQDFEKIPGFVIGYWAKPYVIGLFKKGKPLSVFAKPSKGMMTGNTDKFIMFFWEISFSDMCFGCASHLESENSSKKWYPYFKGGTYRKWYGNIQSVVNFQFDGKALKASNNYGERSPQYYFTKSLTWTKVSSAKFSLRSGMVGALYDDAGCVCPVINDKHYNYLLGLLNSKISEETLKIISQTLNISPGEVSKIPVIEGFTEIQAIDKIVDQLLSISKLDWDTREASWDFEGNELLKHKSTANMEDAYDSYIQYWTNKFVQVHQQEELLNKKLIDAYGLQEDLPPDVKIKDITILQDELYRNQLDSICVPRKEDDQIVNYGDFQLPFDRSEIIKQFISYAIGCLFGRYSLYKPGLILANAEMGIIDYQKIVSDNKSQAGNRFFSEKEFTPEADGIIPVLDDDYFQDDIVSQFKRFLTAAFGKKSFDYNLRFIEDALGKDIRQYFSKDFYNDHIRRYSKRPIYWMFSSPKNGFNALIYLHRYTPDTVSLIRNQYLNPFIEKLKANKEHLIHIKNSASATPAEKTKGDRRIAEIDQLLVELAGYEREVIYPLATEHVALDLDDGVLVNYNKLGAALQEVKGLTGAVKSAEAIETENINIEQ
jgi:type II restriction/modification system DNA methylase subunit YeeA